MARDRKSLRPKPWIPDFPVTFQLIFLSPDFPVTCLILDRCELSLNEQKIQRKQDQRESVDA